MGIGAYRHRVQLEHPAVVLDPVDWDCSLQSAASQVVDGLSAFFVRGRYHPGITLETQLNFEGRTFQVQSVTDVDERHMELQLMCVEVVGRGTTPVPPPPVGVAPTITTPPVNGSVASGQGLTLTVVAAGTPPLAYQWTLAGVDIAGATSASYITGPLTATSVYAVRVSNAYGSVTSSPVTVTVIAPSPLLTNLVSYWKLDEASGTRMDSHGTNHLTPTNNPVGAAGKIGNGCDFEASSTQFLTCPTNATLQIGSSAFTLACWIKFETVAVNQILIDRSPEYALYNGDTNRPKFQIASGSPVIASTIAIPTAGLWYFLVAWHDATADTINIQINNGSVDSISTGGGNPGTAPVPLAIGAFPNATFPFDGLIDEIGFWKRVLTAQERTDLYNAGAGLAYPFA